MNKIKLKLSCIYNRITFEQDPALFRLYYNVELTNVSRDIALPLFIDRWKIAFIKLRFEREKNKIFIARWMIDTILIEIVLYRSDLFAPSIEMFFPQIWFQQDLPANRSPALFASVMKYSPLFSTYIYIRIYMYPYSFEIYSFRSMNWIRGNFRVRSISAKEMKEFRLFRSRLQITFYCLGKNIKVNEKVMRIIGRSMRNHPIFNYFKWK